MRHANKVLGVAVVAAALLYVALYYATVDYAVFELRVVGDGDPILNFEPVADYRFGGKAARMVFLPIHEIDRKLRPSVWSGGPVPVHDPE
jgi:hypothetical protein